MFLCYRKFDSHLTKISSRGSSFLKISVCCSQSVDQVLIIIYQPIAQDLSCRSGNTGLECRVKHLFALWIFYWTYRFSQLEKKNWNKILLNMSSIETENENEPLREVPNLGRVLVNIGEVWHDSNLGYPIFFVLELVVTNKCFDPAGDYWKRYRCIWIHKNTWVDW